MYLIFNCCNNENTIISHFSSFVTVQQSISKGSNNAEIFYKEFDNAEKDNRGKIMKHTIMIIEFGYDEKEDKNYWVTKNSYGKNWGIHGYGKIAMIPVF